jgi:electron transfer flavoprotein alpha subunit
VTAADLPAGPGAHPVAVLVCRAGEPPLGADEAVTEAGGNVVLAGEGAAEAASALVSARQVWILATEPGLRAGTLARQLAGVLADSPLVVLPASADGRDLAPRLAVVLDRPLLTGAKRVGLVPAPGGEHEIEAVLTRLDGRLELPVRVGVPAIATLPPGVGSVVEAESHQVVELVVATTEGSSSAPDVEVLEVIEPDPSTMDLAEAPRVVAGGAGLLPPGADDATGRAVFDLLAAIGGRLGAAAGATRVATDAGWMGFERQIGTTGITLDPDLYLAFGISGATQHTGGIGSPQHVISVNTDASCPMTAMATLGLVTDARALLVELAGRLGVPVPPETGLPAAEAGGSPGRDGARQADGPLHGPGHGQGDGQGTTSQEVTV